MNWRSVCLLMVGMAVYGWGGTAFSDQGNPGIAPINSRINSVQSYADLGAQWWQWALQAPASQSPLVDTTGENCRVGQAGPVWFLAGTQDDVPVDRACDVPAGKAIFFPVVNFSYLAFLNDPADDRTPEYVRFVTDWACDSDSIRDVVVTIDGKPVARATRFVTTADQSPLFQVQLLPDNVFGLTESVAEELLLSPAAHQGLYIYVKPLPPGSHEIAWKATWDCYFGEQTQDVSYDLEVLTGVSGQVDQ